jgi:hypothetical protein
VETMKLDENSSQPDVLLSPDQLQNFAELNWL